MPTSIEPPILIVGGGLVGLTLAALLEKNGIPYLVFESNARGKSQQHGITLYPWAYQTLAEALEITPLQLRGAVAVDRAVGGNGVVDLSLLDAYTGHVLVLPKKDQSGAFRANKRAMHEYLLEHIDSSKILWEWTFTSSFTDSGCLLAEFENGEKVKGRLLVAADGLSSAGTSEPITRCLPTNKLTRNDTTVRSSVIPEMVASETPVTVYNGRRTMSRSVFEALYKPHMQGSNAILGAADDAVLGISVNSLNDKEATLSWTYSRAGVSQIDPSLQQLQPHPGITSTVIDEVTRLQGLSAPFKHLTQDVETARDTLYNWKMRSIRIPFAYLPTLPPRRILLIGDAAHAMPIYLGDGGNHAITDAVDLAKILSTTPSNSEVWHTTDMDIVSIFYSQAYQRWQEAIEASEMKLQWMHRSIEIWRAIASESE